MKSLFKFSWRQMWCGQPIPGETIKEPSRRHFLLSHPPLTLTIYRHPRNLFTPSQNVCHQIQKKKNGLGPETRWQSITNVLCAPSHSPLSVVPSFVLPSREPPPDSPQVYFVPPSLLTRSTVLLLQNSCVLHSRILFYLLSHSPSSAASIEGREHRPPASFKFTFSSSHHSAWNINPIYWRSSVNTKCHLCTNP